MLTAPLILDPYTGEMVPGGDARWVSLKVVYTSGLKPGEVKAHVSDGLVFVGKGEGIDVPTPKPLTDNEKLAELAKKEQEVLRAKAEKDMADRAAQIDAEFKALGKKK